LSGHISFSSQTTRPVTAETDDERNGILTYLLLRDFRYLGDLPHHQRCYLCWTILQDELFSFFLMNFQDDICCFRFQMLCKKQKTARRQETCAILGLQSSFLQTKSYWEDTVPLDVRQFPGFRYPLQVVSKSALPTCRVCEWADLVFYQDSLRSTWLECRRPDVGIHPRGHEDLVPLNENWWVSKFFSFRRFKNQQPCTITCGNNICLNLALDAKSCLNKRLNKCVPTILSSLHLCHATDTYKVPI